MTHHESTPLDLVGCPECEAPAEVVDRFELPGTSGPVDHVTIRCVRRHWFTMLAESLVTAGSAPDVPDRPAPVHGTPYR